MSLFSSVNWFRYYGLILLFGVFSSVFFLGHSQNSSSKSVREYGESPVSKNLKLAGGFTAFHSKADYDSTLHYLNLALDLSTKLKEDKYLYDIYFLFNKTLSSSGNYSIALDYSFKTINLLEDQLKISSDTMVFNRMVVTYISIGTCYLGVGNSKKALDYFGKALTFTDSVAHMNIPSRVNSQRCAIYNNLGSAYLIDRQLENAKWYYEQALVYSYKLDNLTYTSSLYNNLGIISREQNDMEKALKYYNKSIDIRSKMKDTLALAQSYNNLGNYYYYMGNYPKAISILKQSLEFSHRLSGVKSEMIAATFLGRAYEKLKDYPNALRMYKKSFELQDSIMSKDQVKMVTQLELEYQYQKQQEQDELRQQLLLSEKERRILISIIAISILFFSTLILVLLNRQQRIKMKQSKLHEEGLALEAKHLVLHNKHLEQNLEFKNKELATYVLYLTKKNEFIASTTEKLQNIKSAIGEEYQSLIETIIHEMKSNIDNTVWSEFEVRFQQVHQDFYERLIVKFPALTSNEKKLCAFLCLNMSTKEISAITFQSVKSIEVARTRLRKKMGLDRDDNLISFLQQL